MKPKQCLGVSALDIWVQRHDAQLLYVAFEFEFNSFMCMINSGHNSLRRANVHCKASCISDLPCNWPLAPVARAYQARVVAIDVSALAFHQNAVHKIAVFERRSAS